MKSYNQLIFKEKILDLNSETTNYHIEQLDALHKETENNLSKFYKKLIDYKNFDYKK